MQPEVSVSVSVSVPIYNVSKFIEKCARSLFEQTFQSIEYIFVNDATPDNSIALLLNIIEQYPERKDNVRIINHPVNRGLAAARKTGINHSSGKYIATVDSDDYIEPDMIEQLHRALTANEADIAVADIIKEYPEGRVEIQNYALSDDMEENRYNILIGTKSPSYLCGKMVAKKLFEHKAFVPVPDGMNYLEDKFVVSQLYFLTDKIVKVEKPLYHYIQYNSSSLTIVPKNRSHFECAFYLWDFLAKFLKEQNVYDKYKEALDIEKIKHKASMMISTNSYMLRKEYASKYKEEESKYFALLTRGKRIITFLNQHNLFMLSQLYHYGVCLQHYFFKKRCI
jgi:Glycosyltransferases involved in cell wall biogenesis